MTDDDRTISRSELGRLAAESQGQVSAILLIGGREPIEVTGPIAIGREASGLPGVESIVLSDDPLVSKSHVRIELQGDQLYATDLGSSNGTRIEANGQSIDLAKGVATPVPDGARLQVGDTVVEVSLTSAAAQAEPALSWAPQPVDGPGVISAVPSAAAASALPPLPQTLPPTGAPMPPTGAASEACATCGRALVAGARFCDGCGSPSASTASAPPPVGAPISMPGAAAAGPPVAGSSSLPDWAASPSGSGNTSPENSKKRRNIMIAAAVAVVVAVGVGGVLLLGGGDDGSSSGSADLQRLPETIERQWSEDVDGAASVGGDTSRIYVAAVDNDDSQVYALDGDDGAEVWQVDFRRDQSYTFIYGEIDGVLLAQSCDFDGNCVLAGFASSDGEELWDEESDDKFLRVVGGSLLWGNGEEAELLDAKTGESGERVRGDSVNVTGQYVYTYDDPDEVEVFDAATLQSRFGPVEIDEDASDWVFDGSNLIVAVDDELIFLDQEGDEVRTSSVSDPIFRVESGPNGLLLLDTEDDVVAVKPTDGRAEEVWSERGSMGSVTPTDVGLVVSVNNGDDFDVLDASNGEVLVSLRDFFDNEQQVLANGVLEIPYDGGDSTATAFSTGDELWQDEFDGELLVVDGGIVTLDDGEVTLYR